MAHTAHDIDELAHALYNLSALRRELQRFAGGEHAVAGLMVLSAVERIGPARISDVAADVQVNLSVASRQIQALQDEGFVDRVADPHDGRSSLVAITDDGTAKLAGAHQRLLDALGIAVADWDHDEVTGLADGIVRLREAFSGCDARPTYVPADRPAADPTLTSAHPADAHHEEQSR
ncbi:MarR family winged helix-turn-helix transcriptional regulator [Patulibacter minatonensis]|uniref:MarR family winged helix-turn-helix transcriptional regulator n=1 Tax=Patulibacter minatonensis TaxID=298163 RepID=UPI00047CBF55|nr:MarR family winged helix-turn-helix transcriptional regulator [Patulibacter minatonensis]